MKVCFQVIFSILFILSLQGIVHAKLPAGFKETTVVKSLPSPSTFSFAPDGRLFICEQTGEIRIFRDGALQKELFLKLDVDAEGEHGLLGITFDPQFDSNHYMYVYYTAKTPYVHNRVSRFVADNDVAKGENEEILLELNDMQGSIYHSAGAVRFGNDGKLYVGVGENGGRPYVRNAQLLTNPFGKVLRINSDGSIPTDNPFYIVTTGIYRAIWALGLRNPFTISFQPGTNRVFFNDVGPIDWEEINEGEAGANYGWPDASGVSTDTRYSNPIFAYAHGPIDDDKVGCAISGGTFYNPKIPHFPDTYTGKYFFIDYCNNWMRILNPEDKSVTTFTKDLSPNPVSLEVGPDGALYYMSRWMKGIFRIKYTPAPSTPNPSIGVARLNSNLF
ncbi:MAG: PQQ-dependent sugar dehydrogenase [Bdellovibrionia bacterium]